MKVLVLSPTVPWPLDRGDRVRIYNMVKELSTKHEVDSISAVDRFYEHTGEAVEQLRKACSSVTLVPLPHRSIVSRAVLKAAYVMAHYTFGVDSSEFYFNLWPLVHAVRRAIRSCNYDVVLTNYWYTAYKAVREAQTATICDTIDVISQNASRLHSITSKSPIEKWLAVRHTARLRKKETEVLNSHDLLICVHDEDVRLLREELGVHTPTLSIAHVRDKQRMAYACPSIGKDVVLFFGALHSPMNKDAALIAATKILPLIKREIPGAELHLAGSGVDSHIQSLAMLDGVRIVGYAADLEKLFHSAKVLLLPLRMGSGIKGRVLEAMEAGIPVVGSTIAAEGIPVKLGETMIVSDEPDELASWVVRLLKDANLRQRISRNAREFVEKTYSWENTYGSIHRCLELAKAIHQQKNRPSQ